MKNCDRGCVGESKPMFVGQEWSLLNRPVKPISALAYLKNVGTSIPTIRPSIRPSVHTHVKTENYVKVEIQSITEMTTVKIRSITKMIAHQNNPRACLRQKRRPVFAVRPWVKPFGLQCITQRRSACSKTLYEQVEQNSPI